MERITVKAESGDPEVLADHLEHVAGKVREGFTSGGVEGEASWGWVSEPEEPTEAVVRFFPQVWDGSDRALTGAPVSFTVPYEDALNGDGELVEDHSHESDQLRHHENAPELAREWAGPFYVVVDEVR